MTDIIEPADNDEPRDGPKTDPVPAQPPEDDPGTAPKPTEDED